MRTVVLFLGSVIAFLAAFASTLDAQQRSPSELLTTMQYGSTVMISADGRRHVGHFRGVTPSGASLASADGRVQSFDVLQIDSVWRPDDHRKRGATLGAAVGAVSFGIIGRQIELSGTRSADATFHSGWAGFAVGGLVGAGVGALGGWVIGHTIRRWELIGP